MTYRNCVFVACLSVVLCGLCQAAAGATLCVSKNPNPGCPYSTIGAAVAAASAGDVVQVSFGTYREGVVIGKAISLVGANRVNTIIDATGMPNGIYVDGLDNAGLSGVTVSGFQVQNAKFEGILVTAASDVTISANHVLKNNLNLVVGSNICTDVPPFDTSEGQDCGEGIHLSGTDHSIVADNLVEKNSGGILITDDTGATHDNLILGNTVQDNPYACGITMASHPLYSTTPGPPTAAGVFHNTVAGNLSQRNGAGLPGAGAGVGMFAPAPFNKTYANVVVDNILTNNGLPGVAMHAHSPGATVADNMIAGNFIAGNAADTEDTATPGPTGINVSGGDNGSGGPLATITGIVIAGNVIQQETIGIATKTNSLVGAHLNNFIFLQKGVDNLAGGTVDATLNWWGCSRGPGAVGCAAISGTNILYVPFLTFPF
jgi:parallel beta-helix repeat protein